LGAAGKLEAGACGFRCRNMGKTMAEQAEGRAGLKGRVEVEKKLLCRSAYTTAAPLWEVIFRGL
jgi:hypothetical protein